MGARPVLATVALGVGPLATEAWILACYRGMTALAALHGARIAGGDIVARPSCRSRITVVGEVSRTRLKRRDGGKAGRRAGGDGPARRAAARAWSYAAGRVSGIDDAIRAARARRRSNAPSRGWRKAAGSRASTNVRALMDASDGLATDAARLARASGCGATLADVPVHPAARWPSRRRSGDEARRVRSRRRRRFRAARGRRARAPFPYLAARFAARFGRPLLPSGGWMRDPGLRYDAGDGAARPRRRRLRSPRAGGTQRGAMTSTRSSR